MAGYIGSKSSVTQVDGITKNGGTLEGDLSFGDNDKAKFGAGTDLQIYHDGISGNTFIDEGGSGSLFIRDNDNIALKRQTDNANMVVARAGAEVELYHNGSEKLATTSTGIDVTGTVTSDGLTVDGNIDSQKYKLFDGSTFAGGMFVEKDVTGSGSSNDISIFADGITNGGNIHFMTGGTADVRLTVDSSGKVIIGTEPDDTYSNGWSSTGGVQDSSRDSTAGRTHYQFRNPNGSVGTIQTSGSSTSYNTSSDYRLKENVVDLTGASARVNQLNPSRFNFIADDTNTLVDGFLAHEVATVVPEAINGTHNEVEVWKDDEELPDGVSAGDNKLDDDGNTIPVYQGIDQSKLVPLLTAALQEALTEIASLKTRVEALEA